MEEITNQCKENSYNDVANPNQYVSMEPPIECTSPPLKEIDMNIIENRQNTCDCGRQLCGPSTLRYIQPPRAKSFKPENNYNRPTCNMEFETVYKNSYIPIDACTAEKFRLKKIVHKDNIIKACEKMDTMTTSGLSYPGHQCIKPAAVIMPPPSRIFGTGPMHSVTTQMHDYVPKPTSIRNPIMPITHILRSSGNIEKDTTFSLSYMPVNVCQHPPPGPIKPLNTYQKPEGPMECETIQRTSYVPNCPPAREIYPWAAKKKFCLPTVPMEKETTYKLSYIPNCKPTKAITMYPISNGQLFGDAQFSNETTYNKSYYEVCGERAKPIIQPNMLSLPKEKQDTCTVYSTSFMGHCGYEKTTPFMPINSNLMNSGPMQTITTQMHDFVPKPYSKRNPKAQRDTLRDSKAPIEKSTVFSMSYITPNMQNFQRAREIRPMNQNVKLEGPMETETTYKLSYIPNCPTVKECFPWAVKPTYRRPTEQMETSTIQKMSYAPPGTFVDGTGACSCDFAQQCKYENFTFPRAAIVN